jgi:hypothetical protein
MINTPGIQSTGPQGLPGSTSQPAIANEQDEALFDAMMAQPQSAATNPENKSIQEELQSRYQTALDNYEAAKQTGDPKQINVALMEIISLNNLRKEEEFQSRYQTALEQTGDPKQISIAGLTEGWKVSGGEF